MPTERIQKALAVAGVGSRREVERWIREGRLTVDGVVPELGQKLDPGAKILLDGRPVRVRAARGPSRILLHHRSPGEALDLKEVVARAAERLELPHASGRWLVVNPLPPVDGGLEILTEDGAWAYRVTRGLHALTMDYLLRVRGRLDEAQLGEFRAATECEGEPMVILAAEAQYGEGLNHWLRVTVRATRTALVRHWWAARGLVVSRLMRVRFGPVHLGRDLPRGHARELTLAERHALDNEIRAALQPAPEETSARPALGE